MKSRRKIVLPNKAVLKRSESITNNSRSAGENPLNRRARTFSATSLQDSLNFLQQHSKIFVHTTPYEYNCAGDADRYFKQTLRSYEYFDLKPFKSVSSHTVKYVQSTETLRNTYANQRINPAFVQKKNASTGTTPKSHHTKSLYFPKDSLKSDDSKHSDVDLDVFYSPNSNSSSQTLRNQADSEGEEPVMAEEEAGEQVGEGGPEDETQHVPGVFEIPPQPEDVEGGNAAATEPVTEVETEEEDDEMKEVERIIKQASTELEQVAEENKQLLGDLGGEETTEEEGVEEVVVATTAPAGGDGSFFKFDPAIDAAVLRELEDAEKQAKETAKIIYELKTRVTELLKKEKCTEAEARELEEKNKELKRQMVLFEEKTKRIQFLIGQSNLFEKMIPPQPPLVVRHKEDILPKVVVCGVTDQNIPRLIMCEDKNRGKPCKSRKGKSPEEKMLKSCVPKIAKRLSDSYTMQEKLAAENADLEGMRYKLQSDLVNKDQTIEYLQKKLCSLQCEMRMICKENAMLNDKVEQVCASNPKEHGRKDKGDRHKKGPCGKSKGTCPAELETRLTEYQETTKTLERQLGDMENEVKVMQTELCAVQQEREHLEQHRKILICPPVCLPPPPAPCAPCAPCIPFTPCIPSIDQQLRELREQYCRLQDDFKSKVTEVGGLRADNEKLKNVAKDAEEMRKAADERAKELEKQMKLMKLEKNQFAGSKEQLIEQEQQLIVAKQRFREAQDELEELRAFIQEQQGQLDDYRNKYLEAQQEVEEQKRHIDILEMDATRINEQVNLEIQRVKAQFQEKLQELLPLPDMLKSTQIKLQEAQQMHLLAERNNDALSKELQVYKDKVAAFAEQLDSIRNDQQMGEDEKFNLTSRIEELEVKVNELQQENDSLQLELSHLEEELDEKEREVQTKSHEVAQLTAQLDSVREESARQVARNKERCETVRRSMQNQISDLERQLAQSRAQARNAQKDRDEIRQKMQAQISNLHENFEDAQMRIRNLQGHVNFLKDTYNPGTVPGIGDAESVSSNQDPCHCGNDY